MENDINVQSNDESVALPRVLTEFLDASTVSQKLRILQENYEEIDERMLSNIEASLDMPGSNASKDKRLDLIMYYLRTRSRFETDRLR